MAGMGRSLARKPGPDSQPSALLGAPGFLPHIAGKWGPSAPACLQQKSWSSPIAGAAGKRGGAQGPLV